MAATRPSIMSLGATRSAPASAWLRAVRASNGSVAVIVHPPPLFLADDAAMAVAHVFAQADIGQHQQLRQILFQQPNRLLDDAVAGISARGLFILRSGIPNSRTAGTPGACASSASRTTSSGDNWNTPGMEATGWRNFRPVRAKSGKTNWPASSEVSRIKRRNAADCRNRRGRSVGKSPVNPKLMPPP